MSFMRLGDSGALRAFWTMQIMSVEVAWGCKWWFAVVATCTMPSLPAGERLLLAWIVRVVNLKVLTPSRRPEYSSGGPRINGRSIS